MTQARPTSKAVLAQTIGSQVKAQRKSQQLSLEKLSLRSDVTLSNIQKIEKGAKPHLSVFTLAKLADALGTTICELVERKE